MLTEALREAQSQNKDLSRQVQELMAVRVQLQNERDSLSAELSESKDSLKDALARLEAANGALTQLRTDMEHRLREKDDEIDNIRLVLTISDRLQTLTHCAEWSKFVVDYFFAQSDRLYSVTGSFRSPSMSRNGRRCTIAASC